MSRLSEDLEIRELFEELRKEEEQHVPSFDRVLTGSQSPGFRVRRLPAWGLAAGVIAVLLILIPATLMIQNGGDQAAGVAELDVANWESPTDFLLDFDDDSLLSEIPSLDLNLEDWTLSNGTSQR